MVMNCDFIKPGMYYRLKGRDIVPINSRAEMEAYFAEMTSSNHDNRRIAFTEVEGYSVSTIFLWLNHAYGGADPVLFETAVFYDAEEDADSYDVDHTRYCTYEEAEVGHEQAVARLRMWLDEYRPKPEPVGEPQPSPRNLIRKLDI